jgi:hypothetical protein
MQCYAEVPLQGILHRQIAMENSPWNFLENPSNENAVVVIVTAPTVGTHSSKDDR